MELKGSKILEGQIYHSQCLKMDGFVYDQEKMSLLS